MSIKAMNWVWHLAGINEAHEKLVLLALDDNTNDNWEAWPSLDMIARKTSQDRRTVWRVLKRLKKSGWIEDTGERKGRTKSIKVYRLLSRDSDAPINEENRDNDAPPKQVHPCTEAGASVQEAGASVPREPSGTVIEPFPLPSPKGGTGEKKEFTLQDAEAWINTLFRRSRAWSYEELRLLKEAMPISAEDRALLSWGYTLPRDTEGWAIAAGQRDVLLVTSAHQVANLLRLAQQRGLEQALRAALQKMVVASIGPTTSEMLRGRP